MSNPSPWRTIFWRYKGTSPMRNSAPLGPYSGTLPRGLWEPYWGGLFLISEAPLYIIYWLTPILTIRATAVRYLNKGYTAKLEMLILVNQGPPTDR
jgi:hypothetical protein